MKLFKTPEFISIISATPILICLAGIVFNSKNQYSSKIEVESQSAVIPLIGEGCVKIVYYEGKVKNYTNGKLVNEKTVVTNFSHAERVECP